MIAVTNEQKLVQLYVAMGDRAPDVGGLNYWLGQLEDPANPLSWEDLAAYFYSDSRISGANGWYPPSMSNSEFMTAIYNNVGGSDPDAEGLAYWTGKLDSGEYSRSDVVLKYVQIVNSFDPNDPVYSNLTPEEIANALERQQTLYNKAESGAYFMDMDNPGFDVNDQSTWMWTTSVTSDPQSVATYKQQVDDLAQKYNGKTITLTTGTDNVEGTQFQDLFLGQAGNTTTLQASDVMDGKEGIDTLRVATDGGDPVLVTGFHASNIEVLDVQAQAQGGTTLGLENVSGLEKIISYSSRNDFTIDQLKNMVDMEITGELEKENITIKYHQDANAPQSTQNILLDNNYLGTLDIHEENLALGTTANVATVAITTTGKASTVHDVKGTSNITVAGDQNLKVEALNEKVATFDASGMADTATLDLTLANRDTDFDLTTGNASHAIDLSNSIGNSTVTTGSGDDTIKTGSGNDTVNSGAGDDVISTGLGDDTVNGGAGNDDISSGEGDDTVMGGDGDDTFHFIDTQLKRGDTVQGGDGNDTVIVTAQDQYDGLNMDFQFGDASSGVETLVFDGAAKGEFNASTYNSVLNPDGGNGNVAGIQNYVFAQGLRDDATLKQIAGDNVELNGNLGAHALTITEANDTAADSVNVSVNMTSDQHLSKLVANDDETLNLALNGAYHTLEIGSNVSIVSGDLETLTITGDASLYSDVAISSEHLALIDASAQTGALNLTVDNNPYTPSDPYSNIGNVEVLLGTVSSSPFLENRIEIDNDYASNHVVGQSGDDHVIINNAQDAYLAQQNIELGDGVNVASLENTHGLNHVTSGSGVDVIFGGSGKDVVSSGDGNDTVLGYNGNDEIMTGSGSDWINDGSGDDTVDAGAGDDYLNMSNGDEIVDMGAGNDVITVDFANLDSVDVLDGGADYDVLNVEGEAAYGDSDFRTWDNIEELRMYDNTDLTIGNAFNSSAFNTVDLYGDVANQAHNFHSNTLVSTYDIYTGEGFNKHLDVNLGDGVDTVNLASSGASASVTVAMIDHQLTAEDTIIGTAQADSIELTTTDGLADLSGVRGVETVVAVDGTPGYNNYSTTQINVADATIDASIGNTLTIDASGMNSIPMDLYGNTYPENGQDHATIDASAVTSADKSVVVTTANGMDRVFGGAGNDVIMTGANRDYLYGGDGADTLNGGTGADIFAYKAVTDSDGMLSSIDTIINFNQSEGDQILVDSSMLIGGSITFKGNALNFADAQAAVYNNSGSLEAVYQQDESILWYDANDDGILDNNDLRIHLDNPQRAGFEMTGADLGITTPDGTADHNYDHDVQTTANVPTLSVAQYYAQTPSHWNIDDTAANIAADNGTAVNDAINVEASTPATVAQSITINGLSNTGWTTYDVSDTVGNLTGLVPIELGAVNNAGELFVDNNANGWDDNDVISAAQAQEISAYLPAKHYNVSDTVGNVLNASNANGMNGAHNITVTDAATVAQAEAVEAFGNSGSNAYFIVDSSTNILAGSATVTEVASTITATDLVDAATATALMAFNDPSDPDYPTTVVFSIEDDAAGVLDPANAAAVAHASDVTVTDDMTVVEAIALYAMNSNSTYSVKDGAQNIVDAANDSASRPALENATMVEAMAISTYAQAEVIYSLKDADTDVFYSIADDAATLLSGNADVLNAAYDISVAGALTADQAFAMYSLTNTGATYYDVEDEASNIANGNAGAMNNADDITATTDATAAEAAIINGFTNSGATYYDVSDTAAHLAAADADAMNNAHDITATDAATAAQAVTIHGYTNSGFTHYSVTDTFANIDGVDDAVMNDAINITVTDDITAAQAKVIDDYTNSGVNTYDVSDTITNIMNATYAAALNGAHDITVDNDGNGFDDHDVVTAAQAKYVDDLGNSGHNYYNVEDTVASITASANAQAMNGAHNITATDVATVADATTMYNFTNSGTTSYSVYDTASNLYNASAAVMNNATDITATTDASVTQAHTINGYSNSGSTTYNVSDTAAALAGANAGDMNHAVNITATDAATAAEAVTIYNFTNSGTTTYDIVDSPVNVIAADQAAMGHAGDINTTATNATAAQAEALYALDDSAAATDGVATTVHYDVQDTVSNILNANTDAMKHATDLIATDPASIFQAEQLYALNHAAQYSIFDQADDILAGDDAVVGQAQSVTVDGTATVAQAEQLYGQNTHLTYNLSDTAAAIVAGNPTVMNLATHITATTNATYEQAATIYGWDNAATYSIEDSGAHIAAGSANVLGQAQDVIVTGTVTVAQAETIYGLDPTAQYSISDTSDKIATALTTGDSALNAVKAAQDLSVDSVAGTIANATLVLNLDQFGNLQVAANLNANDNVKIAGDSGSLNAVNVDTPYGGNGTLKLGDPAINGSYNLTIAGTAGLTHVVLDGSGNMRVDASTSVLGISVTSNQATATGDHTVIGTQFMDTIKTGSGDDVIDGKGGDDTLMGRNGNDQITGGAGFDYMDGGKGDDTFVIVKSDDYTNGSLSDTIIGGNGSNDTIRFSNDTDHDTLTLSANVSGVEYIKVTGNFNGSIDASVVPQSGDLQEIDGDNTDNTLIGNGESIIINGYSGNDIINGGTDAVNGQILNGDDGNDVFVYNDDADIKFDAIDGGSGTEDAIVYADDSTAGDTLTLSNAFSITNVEFAYISSTANLNLDASGSNGVSLIAGGSGNNTVIGNNQDNTMYGSYSVGIDGSDTIHGGNGNDTIYGGDRGDTSEEGTSVDGSDIIYGETGNDELYGQVGNDYLDGGSGNDLIFGGADNDTIYTGEGADIVKGGTGNDYINLSETTDKVDTVEFSYFVTQNDGYDLIDNFRDNSAANMDKVKFVGTNDLVTAVVGNEHTSAKVDATAGPTQTLQHGMNVVYHITAGSLGTGDVANALAGKVEFVHHSGGDVLYLAVDDGTDTGIYRVVEDVNATDEVIHANELTQIMTLSGVDTDNLNAGQFDLS